MIVIISSRINIVRERYLTIHSEQLTNKQICKYNKKHYKIANILHKKNDFVETSKNLAKYTYRSENNFIRPSK